jgi:hypothetical protein
MKRSIYYLSISILFLVFIDNDAAAQCVMCKMAAEEGAKAGNTQTLGINSAIMYLAIFPYLIISTIAILWLRAYRKKKKEEAEIEGM